MVESLFRFIINTQAWQLSVNTLKSIR